jgi:hypothetical protein
MNKKIYSNDKSKNNNNNIFLLFLLYSSMHTISSAGNHVYYSPHWLPRTKKMKNANMRVPATASESYKN